MSDIYDSITPRNQQRQLTKSHNFQKQDFTIPHCENNSEEISYQPNISYDMPKTYQNNSPIEILDRINSNIIDDFKKTDSKKNIWVNGGLRIMFYITKFIKQMKNHSSSIQFKTLTKDILYLISDSASDMVVLLDNFKINKSKIFIQYLVFLFDKVPVFDPDSECKVIWNIFMLFYSILNIFYIPMKLGFDYYDQEWGQLSEIIFQIIPSWFYMMDILFTFFTAYYKQGVIHRGKYQICINYFSNSFFWDLTIIIPFILYLFQVPYMEFFLMLRVIKIKPIIDAIEEVTNPSDTVQSILELLKSIFIVIFVSHCCACMWNLIGQMETNSNNESWLDSKGITNAYWTTRYINAFYFSTITTLTVGYGDIVPVTNIERIFVIGMALVICGLFAYTISSIGNILKQLTEKEQLFKQKMMSINNYLKRIHLSKQLMLSVRKYCEYYIRMEQSYNEFGEIMMTQLNKNLKEKVAIDLYQQMLMNSRLIKQTLTQKSVEKLCLYVKVKKYAPEEVISLQNDLAENLIYLQRGEINLICDYQAREIKLATIESGKFIGEREFIIQSRYDYSIRTSKFSQIAYIDYQSYLSILKEDQQEEHYCMMRDQLRFNEEKSTYGEVCYICKWIHHFKKCPKVFVSVNMARIKRQFMISENQNRKFIRRSGRRDQLSLSLIQEYALTQIINKNLIAIEDLTDQSLEALGFRQNNSQNTHFMKTLFSIKSGTTKQKANESESEQSEQSSSSSVSNQITNQFGNNEKKKIVQFKSPKTEGRNLNRQQSHIKNQDAKKTFLKLAQITHRLSNAAALTVDLNVLQQQFQNSALSQNLSNFTSNLNQNSSSNSQYSNPKQKLNKGNSSSYQSIDREVQKRKNTQQSKFDPTGYQNENQQLKTLNKTQSKLEFQTQPLDKLQDELEYFNNEDEQQRFKLFC